MSQSTASLIADDDHFDGDSPASTGLAGEASDTKTASTGPTGEASDTKARTSRKPRTPKQPRESGDRHLRPVLLEHEDLNDGLPPPQEGHVQLMVRTSIQGEPDYKNIHEHLRKGWEPRLKSTVPEDFYPDTIRLKVQDLDLGDVVGDYDRVLFERPKWLDDREKQREQSRNQRLTDMVQGRVTDGSARELGRGVVVAADIEQGQARASFGDTGRFREGFED